MPSPRRDHRAAGLLVVGVPVAFIVFLGVLTKPSWMTPCGAAFVGRVASTRPFNPTFGSPRSHGPSLRHVLLSDMREILLNTDPSIPEKKQAREKLKEMDEADIEHNETSYNVIVQAASNIGNFMAVERWFTRAEDAGVTLGTETFDAILCAVVDRGIGFEALDTWMKRAKRAKASVPFGKIIQVALTKRDQTMCNHLEKWERRSQKWTYIIQQTKDERLAKEKERADRIARRAKLGITAEDEHLESAIKQEAFGGGTGKGFDERDFLAKEVREGLGRDSAFNF